MTNPHPLADDPRTRLLNDADLYRDWQKLRESFNARRREFKPLGQESSGEARERMHKVLLDMLEQSGIRWSDSRKWRWIVRKTGPEDHSLPRGDWLKVIEEAVWIVDLRGVVETLVSESRPGLLKRQGAPAYAASALLGALLGVTPEQIFSKVSTHSRLRTRARRRSILPSH